MSRRRVRTPSTAHVISARAAVMALRSSHTEVLVYDARNESLAALERVAGAHTYEWGVPSTPLGGRMALVYDAGSSTLERPYSRAASVVHALLRDHPMDARVCLISGGLPALRATAPHLIVSAPRSTAEVDKLRRKLASLKHAPAWARAALEAIVDAARPAAAVLPWLDVGSDQDARTLTTMQARGYTHVVVMGSELSCNFPAEFEYLYIPALDAPSYRLIEHFAEVTQFLRAARMQHEAGVHVRVLVHCYAGLSRSVAVVAAYLIADGFEVECALSHVAARRTGAAPNHGFLAQLSEWRELLRSASAPVPRREDGGGALWTSSPPGQPLASRRASQLEREILDTCMSMSSDAQLSPVSPAEHGRERGERYRYTAMRKMVRGSPKARAFLRDEPDECALAHAEMEL